MSVIKKLITIISVLFIVSCTTFNTAHGNFINTMNLYVKKNATFEMLNDKEIFGSSPIGIEFLVAKRKIGVDFVRYEYSRPNFYGRYCNFYIVVNAKTVIVEWGFVSGKYNPKDDCGISG